MNLPNLSPQQVAFYSLGALTTAGSIVGSFRGIESELGTSLALIGSVALGVATYSALNVMFNHTGVTKRCTAALLSICFIGISGETILLDAMNKQASNLQNQVSTQVADAKVARQQLIDTDTQMKTDLREQLAALDTANLNARADADKRQADLRTQVAEIQRLNRIDHRRIAGFQKEVTRGYKPTTNRANIRAARKAIHQRNRQISNLNTQIETIGNALTDQTQHREVQATGIRKRLTTPLELPAVPAPQAQAAQQVTPLGTRIRAYLYDVMTVIFMLLTSWYRPTLSAKTQTASANVLETSPNTGNTSLDTDNTSPIQDSGIDQYSLDYRSSIDQPDIPVEPSPKALDKSEIIEQLGRFQITPNSYGRITPKVIATLAGWGEGKAKKFMREECVPNGVLDEQEDGRGIFFVYPSVVTRQLSLVQGGCA